MGQYLSAEDVPIVPPKRPDPPSGQKPQPDHDPRDDKEDDQQEAKSERLRYNRVHDEVVAAPLDDRHVLLINLESNGQE
jgi:hypothetical protein